MEPDDELLPISALQHLEFCPRRCALVHVEGLWSDNAQTAEGRSLHRRVHEVPSETVAGIRVARGLRLASQRLGLFGVADVVEFHPLVGDTDACDPPAGTAPTHGPTPARPPDSPSATGIALSGMKGLWRPYPVEYKRGRRKPEMSYFVQLCAQALCLEEMLHVSVPAGALYHGKSRRRQEVSLDAALRDRTERRARELHELLEAARTPPPEPGPKCRFCSLSGKCLPKLPRARSARHYLEAALADHLAEDIP